jgi:GntR family transcriptional regulator
MKLDIDFTSHSPIYVQLTEQIKHKIATGDLVPGDQLPTVRQLAADIRINFNTVARAYRMLDDDGIISTQHGRGTFILEPASEEDAQRMRQEDLERLTAYYLTEVYKLDYSPDEVRQTIIEKLKSWQANGAPLSPKK